MIIAIDASSILSEGGMEHFSQILNNVDYKKISKIYIWSNKKNLKQIKNNKKIIKKNNFFFEFNIFTKLIWQFFFFSAELKKLNCDILFLLSGYNLSSAVCKRVSFFQNTLPFENHVKLTFFGSIKMKILKFLYLKSIDNSDALIFPSYYCKNIILKNKKKKFKIIYHGVDKIFFRKFIRAKNNTTNFFNLIYVSSIDFYKNQLNLIKSLLILKKRGFKIKLNLVGAFKNLSIKKKILRLIKTNNLKKDIFIHENLNKTKILSILKKTDISVYPSFTESFGISLLESMAHSIPICCSNRAAMPEILQTGGLYFDPSDKFDMANKIEVMLNSKKILHNSATVSHTIAKKFSWTKCSLETFNFLNDIKKEKHSSN